MLAIHDGKVCGLGSLKSIDKEIGEIKRMYVDPTFRRIGARRGEADINLWKGDRATLGF